MKKIKIKPERFTYGLGIGIGAVIIIMVILLLFLPKEEWNDTKNIVTLRLSIGTGFSIIFLILSIIRGEGEIVKINAEINSEQKDRL